MPTATVGVEMLTNQAGELESPARPAPELTNPAKEPKSPESPAPVPSTPTRTWPFIRHGNVPSLEHIAAAELEDARDNQWYEEYVNRKHKTEEAADRRADPSQRRTDSGYEPRTTPPVTRSSAAQPDARIGMLRVMESVQETEWSAKRMTANRKAVARGVVQEDHRTWRRNRGAPDPPLTSYSHASNGFDNRCNNCFKFHPDQHGKTSWFTCPKQLDADHQEKAERYFARASKRARATRCSTNHRGAQDTSTNHHRRHQRDTDDAGNSRRWHRRARPTTGCTGGLRRGPAPMGRRGSTRGHINSGMFSRQGSQEQHDRHQRQSGGKGSRRTTTSGDTSHHRFPTS